MLIERILFAPVTRIDRARREVTLVATSEAIDSFGTRFAFAASVAAFQRGLGNVREMHANKAVGRIISWAAEAAQRTITVVVRVSQGAEDTWQKLLDGTLRGASIGASNVRWEAGDDGILTAMAYDLVELSLVDNPSNPDCRVLVMRVEDTTMARRITGRGAVPENSIQGDFGNAPDAISAVQPSMVGKLVLATSTDPTASDYGVPPMPSVTPTPFADGGRGRLSNTATSGGFYTGGHPDTFGVLAQGSPPYTDLDPAWDTSEMQPPVAAQMPLEMPRQRTAGAVIPAWHALRASALGHATRLMEGCGCAECTTLAGSLRGSPQPMTSAHGEGGSTPRRVAVAEEQRAFQQGVVDAFAQLSDVLGVLTERVERIATQPMPGGPVAMATRGFTELPVAQQIATLQRFAARSGDPNVQAEAAAAIMGLQQA